MAKLLNVFMAYPPAETIRSRIVAPDVQVIYAAYDDGSLYFWTQSEGWFQAKIDIPTER